MQAADESDDPLVLASAARSGTHALLAQAGRAADQLGVELLPRLTRPSQDAGWTVTVTLTPTAARWLQESGMLAQIEEASGFPVCVDPQSPTERSPHSLVDCYLVAPASANTVAKLALGIADNQALTQVNEAMGR